MRKIMRLGAICFAVLLLTGPAGLRSNAHAVEAGVYRLLSISTSEKLILISSVPEKKRYLLDASSARITLNGKPAEFESLEQFSAIQVELELKKVKKSGIDLDGSVTEIRISTPAAEE